MKIITKFNLALLCLIISSTIWGVDVPVKVDVQKDKLEISFSLPTDVSYAVSQGSGTSTITLGTKTKLDVDTINQQLGSTAKIDNVIEKDNSIIVKISNPGFKIQKHDREKFGVLLTYVPTADKPQTPNPDKKTAEVIKPDPQSTSSDEIPGILQISNDNEEVRMEFSFSKPTAMAGFLRDGYYLLVFDTDKPLSTKGIFPEGFGNLEQMVDPPYAVFELKRNPNVTAHVMQEDNKWIVLINDKIEMNQGKDRKDVLGQFATDDQNNVSYTIKAPGNGRSFSIKDQRRGDFIHIFTNKENGRLVETEARFPDFTMEESLQGVVITSLLSDLEFNNQPEQITISKKSSLVRSSQKDRDGALNKHSSAFYLDMSKWKIANSDFDKREQLEERLSESSPNQRIKAYYDLAQFYLVNGYAAEALGILRLIGDDVPGLIHEPKYVALRAIASYLIDDYEGAFHDLASPELISLKDGDMWRGLTLNGLRREDKGVEIVMNNKQQLLNLPAAIRNKTLIKVSKSALKIERPDIAMDLYTRIDQQKVDIEDKNDLLFVAMEISKIQNNPEQAQADLKKIMEGQDTKVQVEASLSDVLGKIKSQSITIEDAIDQLEFLRYQWRGNKDEILILDKLADLYIQNRDYKNALKILGLAVKYFPKSPKHAKFKKKMQDTFKEIFADKNDILNPITVIALYEDFKELNPDGVDGDKIVLNVVEKLTLLEFQAKSVSILKERFEKSKTFNETLGMTYLDALMTSKNSEESLKLVDDLLKRPISEGNKKKVLYAKIKLLTTAKKYKEGLALLENDKSDETYKLRAAIYWLMGDWIKVSDNLAAYLITQKDKPDPNIILSYVISLHEGKQFTRLTNVGLSYGKFMTDTPYEKYFKILTSNNLSQEISLDDKAEHLSQVDDFAKFLETAKK